METGYASCNVGHCCQHFNLDLYTYDDVFSPHRCTEDDFYEGFFIPKGAIVIPNVWELNHDPEVWGLDAHLFRPERYLDAKGRLTSGPPGMKDDGSYIFGMSL